MKIYNTMSKKKEEFIPLEEGKCPHVCMWTYCIQLYSHW